MAMARPKQTDLAILGGLSVEPMTGYRLRTEITEVLGHFWHESYGRSPGPREARAGGAHQFDEW